MEERALRFGVIGLNFGRQHVRTLANMEDVAKARGKSCAQVAPACHIHMTFLPSTGCHGDEY
jgi:hypothetical protein